jgi:glucokinase
MPNRVGPQELPTASGPGFGADFLTVPPNERDLEVTDAILAVDIGGTKIAAGLVDRFGQLKEHRSTPTPRSPEPDAAWNALASVVRDVLELAGETNIVGCGVGCGGPMALHGTTVSPLNIPGWREFPLRAELHSLTSLPTYVDNDAKALALGEGWVGAAATQRNFMAMVVSTGVGGGIVLDGRLLDGRLGNAGHIGHVVVEPGGRRCPCGASGCLEAEVSGTAIAAMTGKPAAEASHEVIVRSGMLTGRAVASVVTLLDLSVVVVAGSVALGFGDPFFDAAQHELNRNARLSFARGATVEPGGLAAEGPLVGAGALGWGHLGVDVLAGTGLA